MEENISETSPKPNPLTTVTPLSKTLALILFVVLPFLGFYLGMRYQLALSVPVPTSLVNTNQVNRTNNSFANLTQPQASPTPSTNNETENRKVYVSPKLNFSFRYPMDWQVQETKDVDGSQAINILNEKNDIRLRFTEFLGGMGCEDPTLKITPSTFQIGSEVAKDLSDFCETKHYFIMVSTINKTPLMLQIFFVGTPDEKLGHEVLRSTKNISLSPLAN